MLKAANMKKIDMQVPKEYISETTMRIAALQILHLLNVRKMPLGHIDLESDQENVLINKYKQFEKRLVDLYKSLDLECDAVSCSILKDLDPYKDILEIDKELQKIESNTNDILGKIKSEKESKDEKQELLRLMEMIFNLEIDISQFHECKFLSLSVGLMPSENIERLEFSLSNVYHILIPSTVLGKRRLCFVLASKKDDEKIDKALKSAYFKKLELSIIKEGLDESRIQELRGQIQDIKIDINIGEDYLKKLKKRIENSLFEINQKIYMSLKILYAARSFDRVGDNYLISGWVPQDIIPELEKEVKNACPKVIFSSPDLDQKDNKKNFLKIPTCLKNPSFLKPFERLVFGYDVPSYNEVEPTLFFALSFLLMFGVMFGDVGHGLTLFILGLFISRRIKKASMVQIGLIAMECGVVSTIFGFMYGSIFGFEHILPALWFHPMEDIYFFMKVTVGFGIVIISTGLLLNIINSINDKDFLKGIFGELGIMGLLFYWGCVGFLIVFMVKGRYVLDNAYMLWLLFIPLTVIFFKEPLYNLYSRYILKKKVDEIFPCNLGLFFLESFIEVGDTIIGFLSNTVSFIRVSAFALAHAGLFLAVFALAHTLQTVKGGFFWYWLIVILGNIGIIFVEGMIVSIQTIRLEYYEFFSKFFKGGGELYQPLRINKSMMS